MTESANAKAADKGAAAPAGTTSAPARGRWWRTTLTVLVIAYLASVVLFWAWMMWNGDRGVVGTLLLYSPRWLVGLPLPLLAVLAAIFRPRLLWLLAIALVVIVRPIMGLQVHLDRSATQTHTLRVLTANVDQNDFRPDLLADLIERERPDVVALQEVAIVTRYVWPNGWFVVGRDEFILASPFPIIEREHVRRTTLHGEIVAVRFDVQTPAGDVQVFNVHLLTPRAGLQAMLDEQSLFDNAARHQMAETLRDRALESEIVSKWLAQFDGPKIVLGDFNTPVESRIWRRDWANLADGFSIVGCGFGFTKYSEAGPLLYGSRIDHVLSTGGWQCLKCWVGDDIHSDHRPLLAELELPQPAPRAAAAEK